jgi:hypothetical protein
LTCESAAGLTTPLARMVEPFVIMECPVSSQTEVVNQSAVLSRLVTIGPIR